MYEDQAYSLISFCNWASRSDSSCVGLAEKCLGLHVLCEHMIRLCGNRVARWWLVVIACVSRMLQIRSQCRTIWVLGFFLISMRSTLWRQRSVWLFVCRPWLWNIGRKRKRSVVIGFWSGDAKEPKSTLLQTDLWQWFDCWHFVCSLEVVTDATQRFKSGTLCDIYHVVAGPI